MIWYLYPAPHLAAFLIQFLPHCCSITCDVPSLPNILPLALNELPDIPRYPWKVSKAVQEASLHRGGADGCCGGGERRAALASRRARHSGRPNRKKECRGAACRWGRVGFLYLFNSLTSLRSSTDENLLATRGSSCDYSSSMNPPLVVRRFVRPLGAALISSASSPVSELFQSELKWPSLDSCCYMTKITRAVNQTELQGHKQLDYCKYSTGKVGSSVNCFPQ